MRLFLIAFATALALSPRCLAAGAFAAGPCDSEGYVFGYWQDYSARAAEAGALEKCRNVETDDTVNRCHITASVDGWCMALAGDSAHVCGASATGWAPSLAQAQSLALESCAEHGGANCQIKASTCDQIRRSTPNTAPPAGVPIIQFNPACANPRGSRPSTCLFK